MIVDVFIEEQMQIGLSKWEGERRPERRIAGRKVTLRLNSSFGVRVDFTRFLTWGQKFDAYKPILCLYLFYIRATLLRWHNITKIMLLGNKNFKNVFMYIYVYSEYNE